MYPAGFWWEIKEDEEAETLAEPSLKAVSRVGKET
jgi:hypothetical protein